MVHDRHVVMKSGAQSVSKISLELDKSWMPFYVLEAFLYPISWWI